MRSNAVDRELLDHTDIELRRRHWRRRDKGAARSGPYDCVVLDLRLPDMSGFDLLEKFQAEPALRTCPSSSITGKDSRRR